MGKVHMFILVMIVSLFSNNTWATDVPLCELEAYHLKFKLHSSMMEGTITDQYKDHCNKHSETKKITISVAGMTQYQNTRTVTIKDKIYNTDLDTGRTTVMANPMYESLVKSSKEKGVKDMHKSMLSTLGFQPTGKVRKIAGETCRDYTNQQMMGATNCVTDDGITLRTEAAGMVQEAIEFHRNDPGDEAAYTIPKNAVQPSVKTRPGMEQFKDIMNKMKIPGQDY